MSTEITTINNTEIVSKEFQEFSKKKLFNLIVSNTGCITLDEAVTNVPFKLTGLYVNEDNDGLFAIFGQGDNLIKTRSSSLINALVMYNKAFRDSDDIEVKLIRKKANNSENRYYTLEVVE